MVLSTEEGSMSRRTARVLAPPLAPCSSSARMTCWHRGGAPTRGPSAQLRSAAQLAAKPVVGLRMLGLERAKAGTGGTECKWR